MTEDKAPNGTQMLSSRDYGINAFQAILKGIPYIGATLEQFIFGPLNELRMRRIESTLREVAEILQQRRIRFNAENEDFVNLLESVAPSLSRATTEEKRQRFRDLLVNAAQVPLHDASWEEASLAAELLERLDAPALAVLAAIATSTQDTVTLFSQPSPRAFEGTIDPSKPPNDAFYTFRYEWPVIEEWTRRLREMRLVNTQSHDARGGFGGLSLTPLGKMLVHWTLND